jgi:YfiH family protein
MSAPPHQTSRVLAGVRHGFFGREGGVSTGIYASLNTGTGSNDDAANVAENRRRVASAFAVDRDHLVSVHQVHSPTAVFTDAPWPGERPRADALVTTTPDLALSILTADCTPILFADAHANVIAAAHAGWRGAVSGVIENTVRLMEEHGGERGRIAAAIGPCIHQSSYEVGPEFEVEFLAADPAFARFFVPGAGDRLHFDLPNFCAARLAAAGVRQIETLPLDTYAESRHLYSHRRSVHEKAGDYGRNCSVIMLG